LEHEYCLSDVITKLREQGLSTTATQIRWAINSGKISRPPLDASLRFDFGQRQVQELCDYFSQRQRRGRETHRADSNGHTH